MRILFSDTLLVDCCTIFMPENQQKDKVEAKTASVLPWKLRSDLFISVGASDAHHWVIKDPLKLNYYAVEAEEYAFLKRLDGQSTLATIRQGLMCEFPDVEFSDLNLMAFLASGVKSGILIPRGIGYGEVLARKHQAAQKSAKFRKLFSLISHRFRGIDPTPILRPLNRTLGWMFDRRVQWTGLVFVSVVAVLVLSRWSQLVAEVPTITQLFTPGNLILLTCSVAFIKVLHEFGHALTCHHYGGECHELGCVVIGFLPLLYCDVSDSWLQNNRIRRMQVAAAGIAVELMLAAVCGVLWIASVPGSLHSFFLNVMLLCSLNTVLVNGNPLLRYDGYYVLSDLLQIPNLGQQSRSAAMSLVDRIVLGVPHDRDTRHSIWRSVAMPIFGVASFVYRWLVMLTILLVINQTCRPLRLESISYLLAVSAFAGLAFPVVGFVRQRWMFISNSTGVNLRALVGVVTTITLLIVAFLLPLPYSVEAPCTLSPGVCSPLYVQTAGHVNAHVTYGSRVDAGTEIASLGSSEVALAQARLEGEVGVANSRVIHLTSTRQSIRASASALPAAEKAVHNAKERLATVNAKVARLSLSSPRSGSVYPPRNRTKSAQQKLQQQFWDGRPLDVKNAHAWLKEQTVVAWIGDQSDLRVLAYVSQRDIEFMTADGEVTIGFDSHPGDVLSGKVTRLTKTAESVVPPELSAKGTVRSSPNGTPVNTVFAVYVQVSDDQKGRLPPLYSTGRVSIVCQPRSLSSRLWRLLRHTFAFDI